MFVLLFWTTPFAYPLCMYVSHTPFQLTTFKTTQLMVNPEKKGSGTLPQILAPRPNSDSLQRGLFPIQPESQTRRQTQAERRPSRSKIEKVLEWNKKRAIQGQTRLCGFPCLFRREHERVWCGNCDHDFHPQCPPSQCLKVKYVKVVLFQGAQGHYDHCKLLGCGRTLWFVRCKGTDSVFEYWDPGRL